MKLNNISLKYGEKIVYKDFNIEFPEKKITCILGASGCGKTSLLNIITNSVDYEGLVEKKSEKISYIFQTPVLLNNLTVKQNIEFVLKKQIKDKRKRKDTIEKILTQVELSKEKNKYPVQLSGGMAQRVSLARAFAYDSDILLMDEPFKGLDLSLKKRIMLLFSSLYENNPKTTILVTHDIDEAILLADKIIIIGYNEILYDKTIPRINNRNISDFPEIKKEIYQIL